MKVYYVQPDIVDMIWPAVEESLKPSIEAVPTHDISDVLAQVKSGRNPMYIQVDDETNPQAVVILDTTVYPKGKECRVWLAGSIGEPNWPDLVEFLLQVARENNCKWFSASGRVGWKKYIGGQTIPYVWRETA